VTRPKNTLCLITSRTTLYINMCEIECRKDSSLARGPPRFNAPLWPPSSVTQGQAESGVMVLCSLPILGPCAQRQRYATVCCADRPTFIDYLSINPLLLLLLQGQAESGGMVLVAYAGPVRPAAALRNSVLCLPTDIHSLFDNKPSSSSSSLRQL